MVMASAPLRIKPLGQIPLVQCRSPTCQNRPERGDALRFVQIPRELLLGVIPCPSAAALEIANLGKPPPRKPCHFSAILIEANWTLHGCHWLPPARVKSVVDQ